MDPFYKDTVTIWNFYTDDEENEIWLPTVLNKVRLSVTKGANSSVSGLQNVDTAKLSIKTENLPKEYKKPLEWQALSPDDKKLYFTLTGKVDFYTEGDTSAEVVKENFMNCMKSKHDWCFQITNVDTYTLIPHMEVGGE